MTQAAGISKQAQQEQLIDHRSLGNILAAMTAVFGAGMLPHFIRGLATYYHPLFLEQLRKRSDPFQKTLLKKRVLPEDEQPEAIPAEDLVATLLENDRRNQVEREKAASAGNVNLLHDVAMLAASAVGTPLALATGDLLGEKLTKGIRRDLLDTYSDTLRGSLLGEVRRMVDLSNKIKSDRLGLAELAALPPKVKKRAVLELYQRTGYDLSHLFGERVSLLTGEPLPYTLDSVLRNVKKGEWGARWLVEPVVNVLKDTGEAVLALAEPVYRRLGFPLALLMTTATVLGMGYGITSAIRDVRERRDRLVDRMVEWRAQYAQKMAPTATELRPTMGFFREPSEVRKTREQLLRKVDPAPSTRGFGTSGTSGADIWPF